MQQKSRRGAIHLQERLEQGIDKLIDQELGWRLVGGEDSGTCRIQTGFCELIGMPTEFQETNVLKMTNFKNTFAFLADIPIITEGNKKEQHTVLNTLLDKLEAEISAISANPKTNSPKTKWSVLDFSINKEATKPSKKNGGS